MKVRFIHEDCDPSLAEDRSLPHTAYLVEYKKDSILCYDLVIGSKQSEIFDYYWDKYGPDFVNMSQSEGRINPKLWGVKAPETKKRK